MHAPSRGKCSSVPVEGCQSILPNARRAHDEIRPTKTEVKLRTTMRDVRGLTAALFIAGVAISPCSPSSLRRPGIRPFIGAPEQHRKRGTTRQGACRKTRESRSSPVRDERCNQQDFSSTRVIPLANSKSGRHSVTCRQWCCAFVVNPRAESIAARHCRWRPMPGALRRPQRRPR
jgi:hypothetical protein